MVLCGGFVRLRHDLFGGGNGFLVSCLLHRAAAARASSINLVALHIGLRHHFLALGFGLASSALIFSALAIPSAICSRRCSSIARMGR